MKYCTNCKFYYYNRLLRLYGYISNNPHHCYHPGNLGIDYRFDGKHIELRDYADSLNKNCDCLNYKRKWYKFWIKGDRE